MAITYNKSTGKYVWSKSPDSYYKSPSSSSGGSSSSSYKPGVYYDIDDPNKQYERDGNNFKETTQTIDPSTVPRGNTGGSGRRLGDNINPNTKPGSVYNQDAGVLSAGESEGYQLQKSGTPYWKVNETNTPSQNINAGSYAGDTRPIYRNIDTKETYEYNTAQIKYQQGAYLNPNATDRQLREQAISEAQEDFRDLSTTQRARLNSNSFFQGGSSAVYSSISGFAQASSVQLITDTRPEPRGAFGRSIYEITSYPKGFSTFRSPANYGKATFYTSAFAVAGSGAYKNVKRYGFKEGMAETISGAGPIKIRSGDYMVSPPKNQQGTTVYNLGKNAKGQTVRAYSYNKNGYASEGIEFSKNGYATGSKFTQAPTLIIVAGGLKVQQGNYLTASTYTGSPFGSRTTGKLGAGISEVTSTTYSSFDFKGSQPTGPIIKTENVAGLIKTNPSGINKYWGGGARNIGGGSFRVGSNVRGTVSGTEYNVQKLFNNAPGTTGGSSGGTMQTFKPSTRGIVGGGLTMPKPTTYTQSTTPTIITPKTSQAFTTTRTTPPSIYTGTGQYELTTPQTQIQEQAPVIGNVVRTSPNQRTGGRSSPVLAPVISQAPIINQRPATSQIITPIVNQRTGQIQRPKTAQPILNTPGTNTGFNYNYQPNPIPQPILPSLPLSGGRQAGYGKIPAVKSPTGYTPSLGALLFKIKGSKPKARPTGFNLRPIITPRKRRKKKR